MVKTIKNSFPKFSQLGFRKKILISYILLFVVFLTLLFPFASESVRTIVYKTFKQRVVDIIDSIASSQTEQELIERLTFEQQKLFFRVTLLKQDGQILYDSIPETNASIKTPLPKEIKEALLGSTGYNEAFSAIMGQQLIYVAKAFSFKKETLILRAAFPFKQFDELISEFEWGFLILGSGLLLLFASLTWAIMHHLSKPIQKIINLVKPYQEGKQPTIPKIDQDRQLNKDDDFGKLAITLNSLSEKIQNQIDAITLEKNNQEIILESLGEGIVAVDNLLHVTYTNRFGLNLLVTDKEKFVNQPFQDKDLKVCKELLEECLKQKVVLASTLQLPKIKKYLEILAVPMTSEKGAVLVMQDKTSAHKFLEMGKDFVANASHELKTPITIIRGFAETLADHPELPQEVALEIIKKIVRNCERMETLVRNLLTLADIEKLPFSRLGECNLLELVDTCRQLVLNVYPKATIVVNLIDGIDPIIIADTDLLELAIMNLLTNAAKYSNGDPLIEIKIFEKNHEMVQISIKDSGIGIPEEDLDLIFNRFYTVNKAHSRKLGGSGLGLSITKTIVDKHQGKIEVTSQVGIGTTFTITLPRELAPF